MVCGRGSSGLAAREMELRFMRIRVDICCSYYVELDQYKKETLNDDTLRALKR